MTSTIINERHHRSVSPRLPMIHDMSSMHFHRLDQKLSHDNNNSQAHNDIPEVYKVIFSRILGHIEIPNSHKWKLTDE